MLYQTALTGKISDLIPDAETDADVTSGLDDLCSHLEDAFNPVKFERSNSENYLYVNMYFQTERQAEAVRELAGALTTFNVDVNPVEHDFKTPFERTPEWLREFIFEALIEDSKHDLAEQLCNNMTQAEIDGWKESWDELNAEEAKANQS